MSQMRFLGLALRYSFLLAALVWTPVSADSLRVVVSIAPIHSLVAAVMGDTGAPQLLIPANQSAHHAQLRPSQASALADADLIVWVGPSLERMLVRPMGSIARDAQVLTLIDNVALTRYGWRDDKNAIDHDHGHKHGHGHGRDGDLDPHIWLDPDNAIVMADHILAGLSALNSSAAETYRRNRDRLVTELIALTRYGTQALKSVGSRPLLFHHDAYQYFEKRFGLTGAHALLTDEELPVSAALYARTEKRLGNERVKCVMTEPQLGQSIVTQLAASASARVVQVDPLGAGLQPGPALYPALLRGMVDSVRDCLGGD